MHKVNYEFRRVVEKK